MVSLVICPGLFGKVSIKNDETGEILWEGKSGVTATFPAEQEIRISIIWGLLQTANAHAQVSGGKQYELICRIKPFKTEYSVIELSDQQD